MDYNDMRMIERRCRLRFLNEAAPAFRVGEAFRRQYLHRDKAIKVRVPSFVYDTHATLAKLLKYLVLTNRFLQHQSECVGLSHIPWFRRWGTKSGDIGS